MNTIKKIGLFLGCITALPAVGQSLYTLEECQKMASERNAQMKIAQNDMAEARLQKKEAFSRFFPSAALTGNGFLASDDLLQMPLGAQRLGFVKDGIMGGATATLPVFAGGQIRTGNKLAHVGIEIEEMKLLQTGNEIRLTVEHHYWQIVVLNEKLATLRTVERQLERIASDAGAAVEAGIANRNDLLQVELRKNETRSTRSDLENKLSLSKMVLAQYIGAEESDFEVATNIPEQLPDAPAVLRTDHSTALDATPEYRLLNMNVEANRLQKRMTTGKFLPTVAVGGGYLYHDLLGHSQNAAVGFVSVSIPIAWNASYSVKRQKYRYQTAITQLDDGREQLLIRMQKAWNDLNNAYEQIRIARSSIDQATENLRLNEDYYRAGTSGMSDLMNAQTLFQQSRNKYAETYAQYEIKKLEYRQATGR